MTSKSSYCILCIVIGYGKTSWQTTINLPIGNERHKAMRSTDTENGRKIMAKVEVPLGVDDITVYALRYLAAIGDNNPRETILSSNKRTIFGFAKHAIYMHGANEPRDYVKQKLNGQVKMIRKIVEYKFPECD